MHQFDVKLYLYQLILFVCVVLHLRFYRDQAGKMIKKNMGGMKSEKKKRYGRRTTLYQKQIIKVRNK